MEFPLQITLTYPITAGEEKIDKLIIHNSPKARDLRAMGQQKGDVAKMVALLENLTGTPSSVIDCLDARDFTRVSEIVGSFLS